MKISQLTKLAVIAALGLGLQACSHDKGDKKAGAAPASQAKSQSESDLCPGAVAALWSTFERNQQTFAVDKADGLTRVTIAGYEEQILVNGETQMLTPVHHKSGIEVENKIQVIAECTPQGFTITEKVVGGPMISEYNFAEGKITLKDSYKVKSVVGIQRYKAPSQPVPSA